MILDFFYSAANLKKISRQGWIDKLNIKQPESVADHTYMMSLMSMVLSDNFNLNTVKIIKMSLLHDLAESKIGDLVPEQISKDEKTNLENKTMQEILEYLPESVKTNYEKIWKEFQDGTSEESIFVHDVDKLEMALQAKIYSKEVTTEQIDTFFKSAKNSIQNKHLKNILDNIISD